MKDFSPKLLPCSNLRIRWYFLTRRSFKAKIAGPKPTFLTALPLAFAIEAFKLANWGATQELQAMGRCCVNIAAVAGCWVDAIDHLKDITIPPMSRYCLPFHLATRRTSDLFERELLGFFHASLSEKITEATLRGFFWDPLIAHALGITTLNDNNAVCELDVRKIFETRSSRLIDLAVKSKRFDAPILLVEMAREAVPPGHFHKDFSKLAMSISLACRKLCQRMSAEGLEFMDARIYGAWIGGSQVSFCVAHPHLQITELGAEFSCCSRPPITGASTYTRSPTAAGYPVALGSRELLQVKPANGPLK